jgi:hypothetical protein
MVVSNLAAKPAAPSIRTRSLAGPFESFQIGMKAGEPPQPKIEVQGMSPHEVAAERQAGRGQIAPHGARRRFRSHRADR